MSSPPLSPAGQRRMELHGIVGMSAPMQEVYDRILRFGRSCVPLMIVGETGTGKEMVAQAIRRITGRPVPFVAVNCAAIPETLVESEIFGHERGAFTGATQRREGLLSQAQGGILFLDEVGELPLAVQAKLLRAVEAGEYRAVGAARESCVQFRLITATNRDLDDMVARRRFRADLLHRLGTARIALLPLRDRRDDIPLLTEHFLGRYREKRAGSAAPHGISEEALDLCRAAEWPGNVRQLRNVIEAAAVHASAGRVEAHHLRELVPASPQTGCGALSLKEAMRIREAEIIQDALSKTGGNREAAAVLLDVSVATLYRRLAVLQIPG